MGVISAISLNLPTTFIVIEALNLHFRTAVCLNQNQPSESLQEVVVEEKTRLGSTPPSCYNKCNNCHPCMAVQVPTTPNHVQVEVAASKPMDYFDKGNSYSNYSLLDGNAYVMGTCTIPKASLYSQSIFIPLALCLCLAALLYVLAESSEDLFKKLAK